MHTMKLLITVVVTQVKYEILKGKNCSLYNNI